MTGELAEIEAPFPNVGVALRDAYKIEWVVPIRIASQAVAYMVGGGVRGPSRGLPPLDRVALGSSIIQLARRSLPEEQMALVDARYAVPATCDVEAQLHGLIQHLGDRLHGERAHVPRGYCCEVARRWTHLGKERGDYWWARQLGVNARRLRKWRAERRLPRPGLEALLFAWLQDAETALYEPFRRRGIVP